jgi:tetratricopeptide (TPR) repeat protein
MEAAAQLLASGEVQAAEDKAREILETAPRSVAAHSILGQVCFKKERYHQALMHYEEALEISPDSAEALLGLGDVYESTGNIAGAIEVFTRSIKHHPSAIAYIKLANIHMMNANYEDAVRHYIQASGFDENNPEIFRNIGTACRILGRYDEAIGYLEKSLALDPDDAALQETLGLYYLDTGYPQRAREHFTRAIELGNDTINSRRNLCAILQAQGDFQGAMQCYSELSHQEDDVISRWNHALLSLMTGDFDHGWEEYEYRHHRSLSGTRAFRYPIWSGEDLAGKTVLVYGEQGIGDEIMFASCLHEVTRQAGSCIIECDARLAMLFSTSFPDVTVHGSDRSLADSVQCDSFIESHKADNIDYQLPIGSLPRYYRKHAGDFPRHTGYFRASPDSIGKWRQRLDSLGEGLKIGISWRGGLPQTRAYLRSIPLADWLPILSMTGVHFISLQYTECADEIAALSETHDVTVHQWPDALDDMNETAALITSLDRVISVQTTVVHLTGALGRPGWALVPYSPEWRYLSSGTQMPWYPSITLMRQHALRDWSGLIHQLVDELRLLGG